MADVLDVDDLQIDERTTGEDVEEWDSLRHVRLMIAIEKKFGIRFRNAEIEALQNIGDLVGAIDAKVAAR
jgi:acyl carrier protein